MRPVLLLVPSSVLRPGRPDEHFVAEAAAARELGIGVELVNHDALTHPGGADAAVRRVQGEGPAVYRGWMLRSTEYQEFDDALRRRGVTLATSHEQYRRAHELPGWYADLADLTPRSSWTVGGERADFTEACRVLGPGAAVLRDYTKSLKHHWDEAAFIPELTDEDAAWSIADRFRELRGTDMTGGYVIRRFETFTSAEVRTWWIHGTCHLTGPHPDTPNDLPGTPVDTSAAAPLIAGLGLPFVTADFIQRADGQWRIVELGDGQVSDRPATVPPEQLIDALHTHIGV
ncbi:ATP-grasp domain-containing protein [Nocardia cyriacigeorgica]|uniref:ATP-grasp domain-containing protein n=1 Tax=Nocardia cyriacigeorgica TaxID=135487 RepID=A0A6P1DC44_9NOCA|nr:ATP-grasp domain-containing protein [Nocardia cyriacigeorgica]